MLTDKQKEQLNSFWSILGLSGLFYLLYKLYKRNDDTGKATRKFVHFWIGFTILSLLTVVLYSILLSLGIDATKPTAWFLMIVGLCWLVSLFDSDFGKQLFVLSLVAIVLAIIANNINGHPPFHGF